MWEDAQVPKPPKKKPCCICGHWFEPDPRAGARQKACGKPECQRQRHQRADRAWRARNPDYDRDHRLRLRVRAAEAKAGATGKARAAPGGAGVLGELPWRAVQDEMSLKGRVVLEELLRLVFLKLQDEMRSKVAELTREVHRLLPVALQDETDSGGPAP